MTTREILTLFRGTITWRRFLAAAGCVALGLMLLLVGAYLYLNADLPTIRSLKDYAPLRSTRIYSDDGYLVGELFTERRRVVPISALPEHLVRAFVAAEDAGFFEHEGLDYLGILRAAIKNLRPGAHLQGASTITQQTVKTMVLGPERSYSRKMREAILARELEQMLSKEEILHLYLNQIYFGNGAYGVEEAARTYFDRSARELDLGASAYLAAVPKNPNRYNPVADPKAAKKRQRYVLERMLEQGWADPESAQAAMEAPVPAPVRGAPYLGSAPHYVEHVRRALVEKFGEEAVYERGLTVYTGVHAKAQAMAHRVIREGLERIARKHGWRGASLRIEVDRYARFNKLLEASFAARLEKLEVYNGPRWMVWDLARIDAEALADEDLVVRALHAVPLTEDLRVRGIVAKVDSVADIALVDLGSCYARLPMEAMKWARRYSPTAWTPPPRDPADVLRRGDLVTVQLLELPTSEPPSPGARKPHIAAELLPEPKVEAALVSIDPHTRLVGALVGGYSRSPSGFNRATQARRQPGSAFKPVLYAAGLATSTITPASLCADSPVVIRDPWTGEAWKPENYEDGRYDGNITYRRALTRSKNTCSVKLIEKLQPERVIEMAHKLGITSELPEGLALALGTGDISPLELANAYATIAAGGLRAEPIFVRKVVDYDGKILEEARPEFEEVISPAVAFVLTDMMRSVVEEGTGAKARVLERRLAGKTGTSNESRNVWFSGFSPELVATVWIGFDDNAPMGRATGSSYALPVWIEFMGRALVEFPKRDFSAPPGVVFVRVDADDGRPAEGVGTIEEVFVAGTEPSERTQDLPSIFIEDDEAAPLGVVP